VIVALLLVAVWPTADDKSLALKFVNWAVDPHNNLPILPGPLDMDQGDDADAVNTHDMQENAYYNMYDQGGWLRRRLDLKVAQEPFNPATERQVIVGIAVIAGLLVWRLGLRKPGGTNT
jgi:hypothetical protein